MLYEVITLRCRPGRDCKPFSFSGSGEVKAKVVFAGYGIHAPDKGRDDYERNNFV